MQELDVIFAQLRDAAMESHNGEQRVIHIRVTADALPGSIVCVPVAPERRRAKGPLRLVWTEDGEGAVISDPAHEPLEILVHPEDWNAIRRTAGVQDGVHYGSSPGEHDRVFGVPVITG